MGVGASREFAVEVIDQADRGAGLYAVLENPKVLAFQPCNGPCQQNTANIVRR